MVMETYSPMKENDDKLNLSCAGEKAESHPPPDSGGLPPPPESSDHRALLIKGADDDGDKQKHISYNSVLLRSVVCEKTEINRDFMAKQMQLENEVGNFDISQRLDQLAGSSICHLSCAHSGRLPPPPQNSDHGALLIKGPDDIVSGFVYEIDPKHLPPRTPAQLRSMRVAMVCEKTEMNVAVRFPSKESVKAFFIYSTRETYPALDEKFVMGIALANKVLVKLVTAQTFSQQKSSESFWLIDPSAAEYLKKDNNNNNSSVTHAVDSCLSDSLKLNGVVRRHKEIDAHGVVNGQISSPSIMDGIDKSHLELLACEDEEKNGDDDDIDEEEEKDDDDDDQEGGEEGINDDDQEKVDEEEEEEEEEKVNVIKRGSNMDLKRKRYHFRKIALKKPKRGIVVRIKNQKNNKKPGIKKNTSRARFNKEAIILRNPKDRWSAKRYKMAEENLLSVMISNKATAEKPILRPQLRAEARKKIGDTGLLDHLLKHMIAPESDKRFRRRHNPDGAMEYWLENADLVNIRRDADWVPPPRWKPGDSPTQDPICARELKALKGGFSKMERDLIMAKQMHLEDEVGKLRREMNEVAASKRSQEEENNQAITVVGSKTDHSDKGQRLDQLAKSLGSSICDLGSAHVPVERYKEQLMAISDFVKEIEAAKIERIKSGFRICKPQVNSSSSGSNQILVQVEVATPPSVNSKTAALAQPPHQLLVKPLLAEKRTVKVTMSTNYNHEGDAKNYSSNSASALINLNNAMPLKKLEQSRERKEEPLVPNHLSVQVDQVPTPPSVQVNSSTSALSRPPHQLHDDGAKNYSSNSASVAMPQAHTMMRPSDGVLTTGTTIVSLISDGRAFTSSDGRISREDDGEIREGDGQKIRSIINKEYLGMFAGHVSEGRQLLAKIEKIKKLEDLEEVVIEHLDNTPLFHPNGYTGRVTIVNCSNPDKAEFTEIYCDRVEKIALENKGIYGIGTGGRSAKVELERILKEMEAKKTLLSDEKIAEKTLLSDEKILELITRSIVTIAIRRDCTGGWFMNAITSQDRATIFFKSHYITLLGEYLQDIKGLEKSYILVSVEMLNYGVIQQKRTGLKTMTGVEQVVIIGQEKAVKLVVWLLHTDDRFENPPTTADCPIEPGVVTRLSAENLKNLSNNFFQNRGQNIL